MKIKTPNGHRVGSGALKEARVRASDKVTGYAKQVSKQEKRVSKARAKLEGKYREKAQMPHKASKSAKERLNNSIRKQEQKLNREEVKLDQMQQHAGDAVGHLDAAVDELS